jgi:hypothetical protein
MHFGVPGPHFLLLLENVPIEMSNKPYERKFNPPRDLDSKTRYFEPQHFNRLLNDFNFFPVSVEKGEVARVESCRDGFSRELI